MLVRKLRKLKGDERGVTLVEVVFAMALFFIIGSTFVFAMSAVAKTSNDSTEKSKAVIAQSGISNSFRTDVAGAKAFKIDTAKQNMLLAKSDGTCVKWSFVYGAGDIKKNYGLGRSVATGVPASTPTQFFQTNLSGTDFYNYNNMLRVRFIYNDGAGSQIYTQEAQIKVSGTDGGVCW